MEIAESAGENGVRSEAPVEADGEDQVAVTERERYIMAEQPSNKVWEEEGEERADDSNGYRLLAGLLDHAQVGLDSRQEEKECVGE